MIIKSITLQNFRQYKERKQIVFSTDPTRNVTVFLGNVSRGKSN